MDIKNTPGLHSSTPIQTPAETDKASVGAVPQQDTIPVPPRPEDRVELSGTTPLPPGIEDMHSDEFRFIRTALHKLPGMSTERMEQIRRQIDSGFYTRGQVLSHVAGRIADEVQGHLPSNPGEVPNPEPE